MLSLLRAAAVVHDTALSRFLYSYENRNIARQLLKEKGLKRIKLGIEGFPTFVERKRYGPNGEKFEGQTSHTHSERERERVCVCTCACVCSCFHSSTFCLHSVPLRSGIRYSHLTPMRSFVLRMCACFPWPVDYFYDQSPFIKASWEKEDHKSRHVDFQYVRTNTSTNVLSTIMTS